MKKILLTVLITFVIVFSISQSPYSQAPINRDNISDVQITQYLASMPLFFTENLGQWDNQVKFRANAGGATMWFASDGAYYQFTRTINPDTISIVDKRYGMPDDMMDREPDSLETMMIKANFVGANKNPQMIGVDMMEYKCNYFIGNDKSKWATDVPNYSAVRYEDIYDGIDLKYYGNGSQMEYDFIVEPGADFSQIKIQYDGAEAITVNDEGELIVTTMWGDVVEQCPVVYQIDNNNRIAVNGRYKITGASSFSFELSNYNSKLPVVIDPILTYSTYLGGNDDDGVSSIAVDNSGSAYVTGGTHSTYFPTLNPYQPTLQGYSDVFVTKLSSSGSSLIYSTYLGGSNGEGGTGIAVDNSGSAYVTGNTSSTNFPTLNPYQPTFQGVQDSSDVFVTKLSSSGSSLMYSTYLGGSDGADFSSSIAVDNTGSAYVTGRTSSTDFPTLNPYQPTLQGYSDVFVTKLSSSGSSLIYSTYLGGSGGDYGRSIAVDSSGSAYVTGETGSTDFPTLNPYQPTFHGGFTDVFVTKLSSSGSSLIYSTYLGENDDDAGRSIAVDNTGSAYVTGFTYSTDFPTLNPYQTNQGDQDLFVTKLSSSGSSLMYSTYLGGSDWDYGSSIAVDSSGSAYVTGGTWSTDFPTLNPYQPTHQGGSGYDGDVFVTKLSSSGSSLMYSTYLGGSGGEEANAIAVDTSGAVYVTGGTGSADFPTLNPYQPTNQDVYDLFVTKFAAVPTDIQEYDFDNLPSDFVMSQNYPNPFNPTTTIEFNLPTKSNVTINIYNLLGQKIQQLVNQEYSAGNYKVTWDGTTSDGVQTATGIYFYRIETDTIVETKKMLLLK